MNAEIKAKSLLFRLGCAVFYAQMIEFLICGSVLALKDAKLKDFTADDFFSDDPAKRGPTLGSLISSLKKVAMFESDLEARLNRFVDLRNRVVHRLFFEEVAKARERDMQIRNTIESLISECEYLQTLFLGFVAHLPLSEPIDPDVLRFKESVEPLKLEGQKIVNAVLRKKREI